MRRRPGPLPRITVVTPSFGQGFCIEATIRSVLDQGYPDLEHLVVDGGSTDESVEIIRRYGDRLHWWCSEPDGGPADAINKGLRRATGEIVGWLNSDDLLLPGALHRIGRAFQDSDTQAVCGWRILIDAAGGFVTEQVYPQPTAAVLSHRHILPQETVYWRRSWLERLGLLNPERAYWFDLDYWLRLLDAGVVPRLIRSFQGAFRLHDDQLTARREAVDRELLQIMRARHGPEVDIRSLRRRVPRPWRTRYKLHKKARALRLPGFAWSRRVPPLAAPSRANRTAGATDQGAGSKS